jgi:hypothetical protein
MNASTIKTLTKAGMVGSLAALVMPQVRTGHDGHRKGHRPSLDLHIWAGIALVGFAVWHYNCYQPPVWQENRTRPR